MATVPPAPTKVYLSQITQTSMLAQFNSNGNGGLPILEWQIGSGVSSQNAQNFVDSTGTTKYPGLTPGTTYYFWARGRNSLGWGPWSPTASARTIVGAWVAQTLGTPNGTIIGWKEAIPYVNVNGVWKVARPWVRSAGVWKEST